MEAKSNIYIKSTSAWESLRCNWAYSKSNYGEAAVQVRIKFYTASIPLHNKSAG